jgi:signal transduction histidine kinase
MAKKSASNLEKIHKAGLKFLVPLSQEDLFKTIVHEAVNLVNGDGGIVIIPDGDQMKIVYELMPPSAPPLPRIRSKGFAYRAFKKRQVFVVHKEEMAKERPEVAGFGVGSRIYIPLAYRSKSIGVLVIRSYKKRFFNKDEPDILKLFGSMASLAIRKTQLYEETRKALETRDLFLSMAAHEFRTPLTTVGGYAQLLKNKFHKNSSESKWVRELYWEVNRLTSLVNEFLEASRIQTEKLHYKLHLYSLRKIIEKAISEFKFTRNQHKIIFRNHLLDSSDKIVCDFEKILQMINNLIENAAKFSEPGTKIVITLKSKVPYLVFTLRDYGIGIPKEEQPRIFDAFYRRGTEQAGTGLGLFLAKSVVEAHRGFITVHSKIGKGTTFEVKLPITKL